MQWFVRMPSRSSRRAGISAEWSLMRSASGTADCLVRSESVAPLGVRVIGDGGDRCPPARTYC